VQKCFLFLLVMTISGLCFGASSSDLSKAIKKSDLKSVEELACSLSLTETEWRAFTEMAREVVDQRQIVYSCPKVRVKKKFMMGSWMFLGAYLVGSCGMLSSILLLSLNEKLAFQVLAGSAVVTLGGAIGEIITSVYAAEATIKYRKKQYDDALEIRRIIMCWPLHE